MSRITSGKVEIVAALLSPIIVLILAVAMYVFITFFTPDEASEHIKRAIIIFSVVAAFVSMMAVSVWLAKKLPY